MSEQQCKCTALAQCYCPKPRQILDTLTIIPLLSVIAVYTARILELKAKRDTIRGQIRENLTLKLFLLVGTLVLIGSVIELFVAHRDLNWLVFAAGWACALVSFWVRRQAIMALGRFWSLHIEIRDSHEFVHSGPFRFVRHPAYFSMILELAALALLCQAWITLVITPLLFVPALWLRIRLEEAALVEKFGEKYVEYQRTTPALIPALWRLTR